MQGAPEAASAVSPLLASISSNDAKLLALERRMTGQDASLAAAWPSMGPGATGGSLPANAPTLSQVPGDAAGPRGMPHTANDATAAGYGGISQRQPLASLTIGSQLLAPTTAASGPTGPGAHPDAKRRRTGGGAAAGSSPPGGASAAAVAAAAAAAATAAVAAASASAASASAAAAAGSGPGSGPGLSRTPLGDITPPALERQVRELSRRMSA